MTNTKTSTTAVALTATLGRAAACWYISVLLMSVTWMAVIAALVVTQKLLPPKTIIDVPLALMIIGLGILIVFAPSMVPGLMPAM